MKRNATESSPSADYSQGNAFHWPLEKLLEKLAYTVETVQEAAVEQAVSFEAAANYRVDHMRRRMALEMELERLRAEIELAIRKQAAEIGEKPTEGAIKARLAVHKLIQRAENDLRAAEAMEEYAKLLLEAYRHRRDSLEVVGQLSGAERAMARIVEDAQRQSLSDQRALTDKYGRR
jgi:predicted O-linked N-acetylglucosamine transferase (SPINDLY family)